MYLYHLISRLNMRCAHNMHALTHIKPFKPNGFSYPLSRTRLFLMLGVMGGNFLFFQILIEHPVMK